jgi:hypothetical protein
MTKMISNDHIQLPIDGMDFFLSHRDHAIKHVATLALGSRPRQGLAKVQAKNEARE